MTDCNHLFNQSTEFRSSILENQCSDNLSQTIADFNIEADMIEDVKSLSPAKTSFQLKNAQNTPS